MAGRLGHRTPRWALALLAPLLLGAAASVPGPSGAVQPAGPAAGHSAGVAVSVATLWRSPGSPRPVDRPALGRPARIRAWLSSMTLAQRYALNGRADTQALLGERVRVLRVRGGWVKVAVPDQPSPLDRRGYPGWVPARQLTTRAPSRSRRVATVTARTAWLRTADSRSAGIVEVSFGTNLAYVATTGRYVEVHTPLGAVRRIAATAVVVHPRGTSALPRTPGSLVRTARSFTGVPYLWAGASGFGVDCSGLTWLDYRAHGIVLPRDAGPQAMHGTPVRFAALRPGDLIFYASSGMVHHVTMYAGHHLMVQAPHTGGVVETVPVSRTGYFGARRYLG